MLKAIKILFDILIPRFMKRNAAFIKVVDENHNVKYDLVCEEDLLTEDDYYDFITEVEFLNLFGFAFFPKITVPEEHQN